MPQLHKHFNVSSPLNVLQFRIYPYRFFENFRGCDTILIAVDVHGLLEMETALLQLSEGLQEFDFCNLTRLDKKYRIPIKASVGAKNLGRLQLAKCKFDWILTQEKWNQVRELPTGLYRHSSNGHQYLAGEPGDVNNESLQVVLSLNEYPLHFWEEHVASTKTN